MKKINPGMLAFIGLLLFVVSVQAQTTKSNLLLSLGYFNSDNKIQYLKAVAKTKVNGKFTQVANIPLSFYISSASPTNLLGRGMTNEKGISILFIPPTAQQIWRNSASQSFVVISAGTTLFDSVQSSVDLDKSRIRIDTGSGRTVTATFLAAHNSSWIPVKGVDMKITVKRLGGDLNINETPTYTTDSTGTVSAEFKLDKFPGDSAGNLVLVAEVDDNDSYGNLTTLKTVPWGVPTRFVADFDQRSLFARRGYSPRWLEWMAYSIIAIVWGVLVFLFLQIRKLKRLGVEKYSPVNLSRP